MLKLKPGEIHVWSTILNIHPVQEQQYLTLLSKDEITRANHFYFQTHKQRFIAAHGILRKLLSLYLNIKPQEVQFSYNQYGKPFLPATNHSILQFNLAHSHEMAVFAFTKHHAIGIDIEKIEQKNHLTLAKRFFSDEEYQYLSQLPHSEHTHCFYTIWARKEALIKAIGKGLSISLSSFSTVSIDTPKILIENQLWHVQDIPIHSNYAAAIAMPEKPYKIIYQPFNPQQELS
ncbi:MAG: hypothetical protein A3E83_00480 [Gammaproteobacteria bacterium RIFCSPHIGHO2_12_FULL_41_20]|nr:MAG: hypothetical protein A3E83_00480 [Gammaproteobacteria bacterium RIFCSPHIGHO2_12_FULL_41_20]